MSKDLMRNTNSWGKYVDNCLSSYRTEAGLSQSQLAELSGVNKSFIGQVENRLYMPSLDFMVKVCNYFGVGLGDIFGIDYDALKKEQKK